MDAPDAAPVPVSQAELEATVARMEARLRTHEDPRVRELMARYEGVAARFARDLAADPRDLALAKASALMLVQAALPPAG